MENDEWCHCVVRIGSPALISFNCVCFFSFYFFSCFFEDVTTCLDIEVSLSIPSWQTFIQRFVTQSKLSVVFTKALLFSHKTAYFLNNSHNTYKNGNSKRWNQSHCCPSQEIQGQSQEFHHPNLFLQ